MVKQATAVNNPYDSSWTVHSKAKSVQSDHHLKENQDSFFCVDCDAACRSGSEEDFLTLRFLISTSVTLFCLFFRYLPPKNPVEKTIHLLTYRTCCLHYKV